MSVSLEIQYPNGKITLDENFTLHKQGKIPDAAWDGANQLMKAYQYSPADGHPGYYIMSEIAKATGGKFNNPPTGGSSDKNVIY